MLKYKITIVGCGPTAVYLLDAVMRRIIVNPVLANDLSIALINDSMEFGAGVHKISTPDTARLNRVASQISLVSVVESDTKLNNLIREYGRYYKTFMQWASFKYKEKGEQKYKIEPHDWPVRNLLGEAMIDQFSDLIIILAKLGVKVDKFIGRGEEFNTKAPISVKVSNQIIETEKLVLACGSASINSVENLFYPLQKLDPIIKRGNKIRIIGGGASAVDVIKYLIEKSELSIDVITRTGLIGYSRPTNQKYQDTDFYKGKYLITNNIVNIVEICDTYDKFKDLMMLIIKLEQLQAGICWCTKGKEMPNDFGISEVSRDSIEAAIVVLEKQIKTIIKSKTNIKIENYINKIQNEYGIKHTDQIREALIKAIGELSKHPFKYFPPLSSEDFIEFDLSNSKMGNLGSIFKYVTDGVYRDCRSQVMEALEQKLSLDKLMYVHKFIIEEYLPIHNRLADGCDHDSIEKIYNAIKKGRVKIYASKDYPNYDVSGNEYTTIKCYLQIHGDNGLNCKDDESVNKQLTNRKYHAEFLGADDKYNFGIDLDSTFRLIENGKPVQGLFVLGAAAEGKRVFNHTLCRSDNDYPIIRNINIVANELVNTPKR